MSLNYLEKWRCRGRQAGMTTLGLVILVVFVGLFAFAGIRLTPVYLNYLKVASVVDGVSKEFDGTGASRAAIRSSLTRRFDIESVGEIEAKDITVTSVDGGYEVAATYSHKAPFIANVNFLVDFDKRTLIRR
ncbi:MAG: DUF4845 domain-containing protein [Woeseiaceae bacterium]|nr:DUF4845 domain-containing protein [Woeseiaceae bacterium]